MHFLNAGLRLHSFLADSKCQNMTQDFYSFQLLRLCDRLDALFIMQLETFIFLSASLRSTVQNYCT